MNYGALLYSRDDRDGAEPLLVESDAILAGSDVDTSSFRTITTKLLIRIYAQRDDMDAALRVAMDRIEIANQVMTVRE